MASVRRLQTLIWERAVRMIERFREYKDKEDAVIKADVAFAGFTNGTLRETTLLFERPARF